jgi:hypothetical protein
MTTNLTTDTTNSLDTTTGGTATGPIGDKANQAIGAARDAVTPLADKARGFAKQRPFAAAALAGVVGIAILNTLRGKR